MYIFFYLCRKQCKYEYLFVFELIFLYYNTVLLRVKWWAKECCQKTVSNLSLPCYRYSFITFFILCLYILRAWKQSSFMFEAILVHTVLNIFRNKPVICRNFALFLIYSFETWQESIPHHSTLLFNLFLWDMAGINSPSLNLVI